MRRLVITGDLGFEYWRDIQGYEGKYQVSTYGRVKSLNYHRTGEEQILKSLEDRGGYLMVGLQPNKTIHRLVAQTFLPSPTPEQTDVNHKDENKQNNRVENLEWCTRKENINWGTRNQRISKPVLLYDKQGNLLVEYPSIMEAGRSTGVNNGHISECCNNKRKSAGGYLWKYLN